MAEHPPNIADRLELFRALLLASDSDDSLSEPITVSDSQVSHCGEALKLLTDKVIDYRLIDEEFSCLCSERIGHEDYVARTTVGRSPENRCRNRYSNVLPYDDSRIVLHNPSGASSYINASYIRDKSHESLPILIAGQGPLPHTIEDFWRMVIQQQSTVIVNLAPVVNGQVRGCANYLPFELQQSEVHGDIKVTAKTLKTSSDGMIATRLLEVQCLRSTDPPLPALHVHYLGWPDFGVPTCTTTVRKLFRILYKVPSTLGPIVVHCSAGIGRTGTLCAIDHTLREILLGNLSAVDVLKTIRKFRQQRIDMVEIREQYAFCYKSVHEELMSIVSKQNA